MDWIIGLVAGTSPFWCQYLAHKFPHWTENDGFSSVFIYGWVILMAGLYIGTQTSHEDHMRDFKDHCEERAPDVYLCDYRTYQGPEPAGGGGGQRYNE